MKQSALLIAALALAACQSQSDADNAAEAQPSKTAAATAPTAPAAARKVEEKSDLLEFSYSWPAEAAAIPGLNKQIEEELGRDRVEATATAREDKASREGSDFFAHSLSKEWKVSGNTPRLLSLVAEMSSFTGGAHPNTYYESMMWDRKTAELAAPEDLFANAARSMAEISKRYCKALDDQRAEKRGERLPPSPDDFLTACPPLSEQPLVLADSNGNGRFDTIQVWLAPSVAGPYAEGNYQIDLQIDAALLAALKPEYRASFEG
jgi:hypothetical protein